MSMGSTQPDGHSPRNVVPAQKNNLIIYNKNMSFIFLLLYLWSSSLLGLFCKCTSFQTSSALSWRSAFLSPALVFLELYKIYLALREPHWQVCWFEMFIAQEVSKSCSPDILPSWLYSHLEKSSCFEKE